MSKPGQRFRRVAEPEPLAPNPAPMLPATEFLLRVNGIQAAFGGELGSDSPRVEELRAADPYRQANTSFSLLQRQEGQIVRHTVIDVGMGVVPSLLELEQTHGAHTVDEVLLTHPHFDHYAGLDWLSMCLLRSGRPQQPLPLPVYASPACWEFGPQRVLRYAVERCQLRPLEPGQAFELGQLSITPFAVEHSDKAPGSLGYVVQHGPRKVVITGDFRRVPDEDQPLLYDADVLLADANTWHPAEWTGHQSVLGNLRLIDKWRPRRTYMIHYSGFEDRKHPDDRVHGPLSLRRLAEELQRVAAGRDLRPARHGMILGDGEPWPEAG